MSAREQAHVDDGAASAGALGAHNWGGGVAGARIEETLAQLLGRCRARALAAQERGDAQRGRELRGRVARARERGAEPLEDVAGVELDRGVARALGHARKHLGVSYEARWQTVAQLEAVLAADKAHDVLAAGRVVLRELHGASTPRWPSHACSG